MFTLFHSGGRGCAYCGMRRRRRAACRGRRPGCRARYGGGRRSADQRIARRRVRRSSCPTSASRRPANRSAARARSAANARADFAPWRLLQPACSGACFTCAFQGAVGTCQARLGTDPRDQCEDEAAQSCGATGVCDGTGARDKYPAVSLQSAGVHRNDADVGGALRRQWRLRAPRAQTCAPFMCATDNRCLINWADDSDCVAPNSCINGSCGKKPTGAACGKGSRMQLGVLRAGDLRRQGLPRHLSVVRGAGQRRHLHRRPRWRGSARPVRGPRHATCDSD